VSSERTVTITVRRTPRWLQWWRAVRHPEGRWPLMTSQPYGGPWFGFLVPYWFRSAHRWYAAAFGYFWLPCPLCHRPFGGHEWRQVGGRPDSIPTGDGCNTGICPPCTRAGYGVDE
jgi:hypothetical protein